MNETNNDFLQKVIIPFFMGTIDKNIISTVHDVDGKIILMTNLHARLWGYRNYKELVGKTMFQLEKVDDHLEIITQIDQIRQRVLQEEKTITYMNFFPYNNCIAMLFCYHFPIFAPNGQVVATRILGEQASLFNHAVEVNQHFRPEDTCLAQVRLASKSIKLTKREQEILYLLVIGFSQNDAADYLGITRGTLVKTISAKICPKFDIAGSNTKLLIKKVIKSKYFDNIPRSLLKPKVVLIENDFEHLL